jgi:hypothetical protein
LQFRREIGDCVGPKETNFEPACEDLGRQWSPRREVDLSPPMHGLLFRPRLESSLHL